jgi:hypothetical protein
MQRVCTQCTVLKSVPGSKKQVFQILESSLRDPTEQQKEFSMVQGTLVITKDNKAGKPLTQVRK